MNYKLSLCLHRIHNTDFNSKEFICLNINQILTSRQENFISCKSNNIKIGLKCLANRFYLQNGKIPLQWLNNSIEMFKIKCKKNMRKIKWQNCFDIKCCLLWWMGGWAISYCKNVLWLKSGGIGHP